MTNTAMNLFLRSFFALPNRISLNNIQDPKHNHSKLKPLLERLLGRELLPTVLPYWEGKQFTWYAIAYDESSLRQLREELGHLLGSTYIRYIPKQSSNMTEQLVSSKTGGHYFSFVGNDAAIGRHIQLWLTLWQQRPAHRKKAPIPLGKLLSNFHVALQTGSPDEAERLLRQLEQNPILDVRNALFLRVQMFATFEQWKDLLHLTSLKDLLQAKKPVSVTEAIIQAVYRIELSALEDDVPALIERFQTVVYSAYGNLFRYQVDRFTKPDVMKIFMLRALVDNQRDTAWLPNLLNSIAGSELEVLFDQWRVASKQPSGVSEIAVVPPNQAHDAMMRGEYAHAFDLFENQAVSTERTRYLIYCGAQLLTLVHKQKALAALDEMTPEQQIELQETPLLKRMIDELHRSSNNLPENWMEWLEGIDKRTFHQNVDLAQDGSREWDIRVWVHESHMLTPFIEKWKKLAQHKGEKLETLDCAIPFLLINLKQDKRWAELEWRPIHWMLFHHMIANCNGKPTDLELIKELATVLIRQNLSADDNYLLNNELRKLWKSFGTTHDTEWLLAWLETCTTIYCPDKVGRTKLAIEFDRTLRKGGVALDRWRGVREQLIPSTWDEWLSLLSQCDEDPELLLDQTPQVNKEYWNLLNSDAVSTMTQQILYLALDPSHSLQPLVFLQQLNHLMNQMVEGAAFPNVKYKSFYSAVVDLIFAADECNVDLISHLTTLLQGLFSFEPGEVESRWKDIENWLAVQPNVTMAMSVYELLELFTDYNIPRDKVKRIWDDWTAELIQTYSGFKQNHLSFVYKLGERCSGNYTLLQQLQKFLEIVPETDPIAELVAQRISIFSYREHAATRAAEEIMKRNSHLQVRVCSDDSMTARSAAFAKDNIVIIVTTCISHAIFYGISPYVSKPVYPRSSSETAIIDALEQYALSLTK